MIARFFLAFLVAAPGLTQRRNSLLVELYGDARFTKPLEQVEMTIEKPDHPTTAKVGDRFYFPETSPGDYRVCFRRKNFLDLRATIHLEEHDQPGLRLNMEPDATVLHPVNQPDNLLVAFSAEPLPPPDDPIWRQTMKTEESEASLPPYLRPGLQQILQILIPEAFQLEDFLLVYEFSDPFFSRLIPLPEPPQKLCLSNDGKLFVSTTRSLLIYEVRDNLQFRLRQPLEATLTELTLDTSQNTIVGCSSGERPQLMAWDGKTGRRLWSLPLQFRPTGLKVKGGQAVICGESLRPSARTGFVAKYAIQGVPRRLALRRMQAIPADLQLHPRDGLAYLCFPSANSIWKMRTETLTPEARWNLKLPPVRLAVTPDGKRLFVTQKEDPNLAILDANAGQEQAQTPVGEEVTLQLGGRFLARGSRRAVFELDSQGYRLESSLRFHKSAPRDLLVFP